MKGHDLLLRLEVGATDLCAGTEGGFNAWLKGLGLAPARPST